MPQSVRDVMTPAPSMVRSDASIMEAARMMAESDIGDVIVCDQTGSDAHLRGIVTDRDIAVRAVAVGKDPRTTPVSEVCSGDVATVSPDASVDEVIEMMRDRAVRRIPIVQGDRPIGMVSIGDLAIERDPTSALADISAAPPNT